jgi:uncharacterized damage-inducible protein DinB
MQNLLTNDPYFDNYTKLVDGDVLELLQRQHQEVLEFINAQPDLDYTYADGKWTIRETIFHIIDAEIIFLYRMLRISRGDTDIPLPGFDQDKFIKNIDVSLISDDELLAWFDAQRLATISLIRSIPKQKFSNIGQVSGKPMSAASLLYIIFGHCQHHINIFHERYVQ